MTAATRLWRWPTRSRLALENEYQRNFIRGQQAEVEQLRELAEEAIGYAPEWAVTKWKMRERLAVRG